MFLLLAFKNLIWSYEFYFSFFLCFGISLPITLIRTYQVLYKTKMKKVVLVSTEITVELIRIFQYTLFIAYGTNSPIFTLFSSETWERIFAGIQQLSLSQFIWDLIGFIVVFGIYNTILFAILKKPIVQMIMSKANIRRFEVSTVRTAIMLAYKNLLLIPVSMIYLFKILQII